MGAARQIDSNERRTRPVAATSGARLPASMGEAPECVMGCIVIGCAATMAASVRIPFDIGGYAMDHPILAIRMQGAYGALPYLACAVVAGLSMLNRPKRRISYHHGGRV